MCAVDQGHNRSIALHNSDMRRTLMTLRHVFVLVVLFQASHQLGVGQTQSGAIKWTPELMAEVYGVEDLNVSPDGKSVLYVPTSAAKGYVPQVFAVGPELTEPSQLTHGEKGAVYPRWSPDAKKIAFLSEGNLWIMPAAGGDAQKVTSVASWVSSFKWSNSGKMIAFTSPGETTSRDPVMKGHDSETVIVDSDLNLEHLWIVSLDEPKDGKYPLRKLTGDAYTLMLNVDGWYDWSPDDKSIVFSHTPFPGQEGLPKADISIVDVVTGAIKPLVHSNASEVHPFYSPDGRWIAYQVSEVPFNWRCDWFIRVISTDGAESHELAHTFNQDQYMWGWSHDSTKVIVQDRRGTLFDLYALPLNGKDAQVLNAQYDGFISLSNISANRRWIGFVREDPEHPPEIYVSSIDTFQPVQLTHINDRAPKLPLGHTEVVQWHAVDGQTVEGLVTYPVGFSKGKRYPLLAMAHGGPVGSFLQWFTGRFAPAQGPYPIAVFADEGYVVLRSNIRGSTGYGSKFRHASYHELGGKDFEDLLAGIDYLVNIGTADPDRVGIMGWSYGGFISATALTKSRRFKAASVGAGFTDLVSFAGTFEIPNWVADYYGTFPDNRDIYEERSPVFNSKGVNTPTLIQHGQLDSTVPITQAEELYHALKREGDTVMLEVYPHFGHNIENEFVVAQCARHNVDWFNHYVRDAAEVASTHKK
jgi:dipeptidyl aminopeptidase/acylaminoacyl peptidase